MQQYVNVMLYYSRVNSWNQLNFYKIGNGDKNEMIEELSKIKENFPIYAYSPSHYYFYSQHLTVFSKTF